MDFSKIESGKMEILPVEYEVSSLLNDSYNMISMRAEEKNLKVKVENDSTIPSHLMGDEVRIRQCISNLLTNAVKYTKRGSITLSLNWERIDKDSMVLKISVADTGIGITPENQEKLFSTFQRVDEKRNRSIEGTGLGLAITRQFVNLMGEKFRWKASMGKVLRSGWISRRRLFWIFRWEIFQKNMPDGKKSQESTMNPFRHPMLLCWW